MALCPGVNAIQSHQKGSDIFFTALIRFGEQKRIGNRDLFYRFFKAVKRRLGIDQVNRGHDAVHTVCGIDIRVGHQGVDDGCWVRQACGFDNDALERSLAFVGKLDVNFPKC